MTLEWGHLGKEAGSLSNFYESNVPETSPATFNISSPILVLQGSRSIGLQPIIHTEHGLACWVPVFWSRDCRDSAVATITRTGHKYHSKFEVIQRVVIKWERQLIAKNSGFQGDTVMCEGQLRIHVSIKNSPEGNNELGKFFIWKNCERYWARNKMFYLSSKGFCGEKSYLCLLINPLSL